MKASSHTALSVNLNKVALVRNSRENVIPDPVHAARLCIAAGCHGITVHPRPDRRHIRPDDVRRLATYLRDAHPHIEYNIEGNPFAGPESNGYPGFMALVEEARPAQATLVPDSPDQLTSDHGWTMTPETVDRLGPIVSQLRTWGARVSLFVDAEMTLQDLHKIAELGVERVELYMGPYAEAFGTPEHQEVLERYVRAGERAHQAGLMLNAGHDLNRANLGEFLGDVQGVAEVSIGHALVADALEMGFDATIKAYLAAMGQP